MQIAGNKVYSKINLKVFQKILFGITIAILFVSLFYNNLVLRTKLADNQFAQTKVLYSQSSHPDQELVREIQNAKQYVYFAIYTLTKEDIVSALIAAKMRGIDVRGILDYNQSIIPEEKPWVSKLKKYGIDLKIPFKESGLMHIKMLVTDQAYASGSFNWTTSGTYYNDEVLEIGKAEAIRQRYLQIFEMLYKKY